MSWAWVLGHFLLGPLWWDVQNQSTYRPGQSHASPHRVYPGQTAGAIVGIIWRHSQGFCLVRQLKLKRFHSGQLGALHGPSALGRTTWVLLSMGQGFPRPFMQVAPWQVIWRWSGGGLDYSGVLCACVTFVSQLLGTLTMGVPLWSLLGPPSRTLCWFGSGAWCCWSSKLAVVPRPTCMCALRVDREDSDAHQPLTSPYTAWQSSGAGSFIF